MSLHKAQSSKQSVDPTKPNPNNSNSSSSSTTSRIRQRKKPPRTVKMGSNVSYAHLKEESNNSDEENSKLSLESIVPEKLINGELNIHVQEEEFLDEEDEDEDEVETKTHENESESFWSISVQIFVPFLIAGFGLSCSGLVLDIVQHWPVFIEVPEVFILVPALLGLKGNLEMTLASRLSTQANLGNLDKNWQKIVGNHLSLVQCQAIVVGFLASVVAVIMGWIPQGKFNIVHFLLLCSSSVITASLASFILSSLMVLIIVFSRKFRVNPDNIATPIAASLGDLTTLCILAFVSNAIYGAVESHVWLAPLLLFAYFLSMPLWVSFAKANPVTRKVLYNGWSPVLTAMVISSCGGLILDSTVKRFSGIAVFQPVIAGVGGNLVAVQASRLSTALHCAGRLGTLPKSISAICSNPFKIFFSNDIHSVTSRALVLMTAPGHLVFLGFLQAGHRHTSFTFNFLSCYLLAALIQVILLLYIADILIKFLWKRKIDPDNSAIPFLTALGDLFGTGLLSLAFLFLYYIGDRDADVGD